MSKLLPIFFWADKFAIWLITFTSFKYFYDGILGSNKVIKHLTIETVTHAELPSPVLLYPALYSPNLYF